MEPPRVRAVGPDPVPPSGPLTLARVLASAGLALAAAGCGSMELAPAPGLAAMEEPLPLQHEPEDEAERLELPPGGFTGIYVGDSRESLDAMLSEPEGLLVVRVVENSPADAAGLEVGDLLLEAAGTGGTVELQWPSQWRALELAAEPGSRLRLLYDRAGAEREAELEIVARVHPVDREEAVRLREEDRVGVVVRAATEVEARAAGLGPGAGAVVVGLSGDSPWREAGVRFEDLITRVDGVEVGHPIALVEAIRAAEAGQRLELELLRDGRARRVDAPLSRREREVKEISIPLVFYYGRTPTGSETSALLGLFKLKRNSAAWRMRLLWIVSFGGGDSDRLEEVRR